MAKKKKAELVTQEDIGNIEDLSVEDIMSGKANLGGSMVVDSGVIREAAQILLLSKRIPTKVFKRLEEGLDAVKQIPMKNGDETEFVEVPDYLARHRYAESIMKFLDIEKPVKGVVTKKRQVVNMDKEGKKLAKMSPEELKKYLLEVSKGTEEGEVA